MFSAANTPSFPQFRRFPKEIRLSIWEHAIPEPHVVHIVQDLVTRAMKSYTSIPTVLRINQEPFSVASKQYRRAFRCCKPGQDQPDEDTSYVWFDFERDFLLIDYNITVRWFPDDEVKRIRNLAWYMNPLHFVNNEAIWNLFTGLRKWLLVTELMGSGNILKPRNIPSSKASLLKIAKYHLTPSYDLSFWDVRGKEYLEVKACIELFDKAKMAHRPMLGPQSLPRYARSFSARFMKAWRFYINRSPLDKTSMRSHVD
ncbi:hypothetical protein BOTCAL_0140g00190 [Botryotinia calthae]|uniref:2EXR domain-containing protein n=1 Tax=Botryotinia calthae TaxID=38488 RepID=A0A4Y8D5A7_9HELO|nr:hypothetical protein BOTCAL_0140g00190 [Botryotinia calthae]